MFLVWDFSSFFNLCSSIKVRIGEVQAEKNAFWIYADLFSYNILSMT